MYLQVIAPFHSSHCHHPICAEILLQKYHINFNIITSAKKLEFDLLVEAR